MLENYFNIVYKKLAKDSLLNEDYVQLYIKNFSESLSVLLSSYHAWFNEELRDFNDGVDYGYYHADRSKRTQAMLNDLQVFINQLTSELKLSSKYETIKDQLKSLLGRSGTNIPEGFERIEIDEIIPIFELEKEIFIKGDNKKKLQPIGKGSYANVFKYYDEDYAKEFVIKKALPTLNKKELIRFKREFETMKKIRSPYIVEVYNYDEEKNSYIMELLDCTLYDYLKRKNQLLTLSERCYIINQIIRGFKHLISNDILHRDISPKNILLNDYGDIKVIKISDFGLVKIKESQLTAPDTEFKGSLNDPNLIIEGFKNYSEAHEMYALTYLISIIISGKFSIAKIKNKEIRRFINKGMSAVVEKRFQTINELYEGYLIMKNDLDKKK